MSFSAVPRCCAIGRPRATISCLLLLAALVCTAPAFAEEIVVTVNGMVCSFCAQGIKKTIEPMKGVQKVNPDLENKKVTVTTDDTHAVPDEVLKEAITDAGYDVVKIERKKS